MGVIKYNLSAGGKGFANTVGFERGLGRTGKSEDVIGGKTHAESDGGNGVGAERQGAAEITECGVGGLVTTGLNHLVYQGSVGRMEGKDDLFSTGVFGYILHGAGGGEILHGDAEIGNMNGDLSGQGLAIDLMNTVVAGGKNKAGHGN